MDPLVWGTRNQSPSTHPVTRSLTGDGGCTPGSIMADTSRTTLPAKPLRSFSCHWTHQSKRPAPTSRRPRPEPRHREHSGASPALQRAGHGARRPLRTASEPGTGIRRINSLLKSPSLPTLAGDPGVTLPGPGCHASAGDSSQRSPAAQNGNPQSPSDAGVWAECPPPVTGGLRGLERRVVRPAGVWSWERGFRWLPRGS